MSIVPGRFRSQECSKRAVSGVGIRAQSSNCQFVMPGSHKRRCLSGRSLLPSHDREVHGHDDHDGHDGEAWQHLLELRPRRTREWAPDLKAIPRNQEGELKRASLTHSQRLLSGGMDAKA